MDMADGSTGFVKLIAILNVLSNLNGSHVTLSVEALFMPPLMLEMGTETVFKNVWLKIAGSQLFPNLDFITSHARNFDLCLFGS